MQNRTPKNTVLLMQRGLLIVLLYSYVLTIPPACDIILEKFQWSTVYVYNISKKQEAIADDLARLIL